MFIRVGRPDEQMSIPFELIAARQIFSHQPVPCDRPMHVVSYQMMRFVQVIAAEGRFISPLDSDARC